MPLGSSSAAPVTNPGPKIFRTLRTQESCPLEPAFPGTAEVIVSPSEAATLMTAVSLGRPDCFFRAKSEKASLANFNFCQPCSRHLKRALYPETAADSSVLLRGSERDANLTDLKGVVLALREASLNGRKSLNVSQSENYDRGYALDRYRHLGRIVASRLLGFSMSPGA
jgi:hypothetical protein